MGFINCPFHLHSILLFYLLQILACFLLPLLHLFLGSFPKFFVLLSFLSSIVFNFFQFFPSISYQTSCYSIHIISLLCIFLAVLLLVWSHEDLELNQGGCSGRTPHWILLGTYTNIRWSVHLSPAIT